MHCGHMRAPDLNGFHRRGGMARRSGANSVRRLGLPGWTTVGDDPDAVPLVPPAGTFLDHRRVA